MSKVPARHARAFRSERVAASPRFVDGTFRNTAAVLPRLAPGSAWPVMREFLFRRGRRLPSAPLPSVSPLPGWARPPETGLRATWLGHSTVLLEIDGARVLTDPVWGLRASPSRFAGPKRFQPVPVAIAALPRLDAVIVSHDHYDHLDAPSIAALRRLDVPFFTSLGVGAHLETLGVRPERIVELDWWEHADVPGTGLRLTAAPAQHFSGRGLGDRNRTLWSAFAVRGPRHNVFFSGDTGPTPEHAEIGARLGPFDLIMFEVGAYHPAWGTVHLGPDAAAQAVSALGGGRFLPVHWGTFNLALHDWDQPAERLFELAPTLGLELVMPVLGHPVEPARHDQVRPWWRQIATQPELLALPSANLASAGPQGAVGPGADLADSADSAVTAPRRR
jgi:L-ascorbate metabolism protein UlaG (beta-lactamase superfamily)